MMRFLLVFISLLTFSFIVPETVNTNEKDIIVWHQERPLTWDDFKGKPAKRFAVASTNYDIIKTIEPIGKDSSRIEVKAVFFCNKSWKKQNWVDSTVLIHEQKHFDIVELYARKLRRQLQKHTFSSGKELKTKSDSLYTIIDKEMDVYQDKYDTETEGSMNGEQQHAWNKKISDQIKELNAYSNTLLFIRFAKK